MSNRFSRHDRDDLFSSYNRSASPSKTKDRRAPYGGYGYSGGPGGPSTPPGANAYSYAGAGPSGNTGAPRQQFSSATLDELESQNDEHVGVLTGKVKMLKDLTSLIGDEIRSSSSLADSMNDQFENSRNQLRGTMNRMLRMAQSTGVGWKVWLAFFAVVVLLFWLVKK